MINIANKYHNINTFNNTINNLSIIEWYNTNPQAVIVHLFESINHDFFTSYITIYNKYILYIFNIISNFISCLGIITILKYILHRMLSLKVPVYYIYLVVIFIVCNYIEVNIFISIYYPVLFTELVLSISAVYILLYSRKFGQNHLIVSVITIMWSQTAFVAVETRFGIIPWCALAIAGLCGFQRWIMAYRVGRRNWLQVGSVLSLTMVGFWASRWLLSMSEPLQKVIDSGC